MASSSSRLSLAYRELTGVPGDVPRPESITEIDLTGNQLRDLWSLMPFINTTTLIVDHNQLPVSEAGSVVTAFRVDFAIKKSR